MFVILLPASQLVREREEEGRKEGRGDAATAPIHSGNGLPTGCPLSSQAGMPYAVREGSSW